MEHQQASSVRTRARSVRHDINNDMRVPSVSRFPQVAYNMAAASCRLGDIPNTPDPKTNERLNEVKQLLYVTLEQ